MQHILGQLQEIFTRTKADIEVFNSMLHPVIENAADEHERLYFHHILEEEEQRLERLDILLPMLRKGLDEGMNQGELVQLLQELNLERFGLHNFREHLDLAMFEFKDEERHSQLQSMREQTQADYLSVNELIAELNESFQRQPDLGVMRTPAPAIPVPLEPKVEAAGKTKRWTVGSLKNRS